jgi:hypothetical protein
VNWERGPLVGGSGDVPSALMRKAAILILLLFLLTTAGCGSRNPILPPWPPERPAHQIPPNVSQEIIDDFIFRLMQPVIFMPDIDSWGYDNIWGGLEAVYTQALADGNDSLAERALNSMGHTGLIEFLPTLIDAVNLYPTSTCYALRNMRSDYAVYILIEELDNPDLFVRDGCVGSLEEFPYFSEFTYAQERTIAALEWRLGVEPEAWIREDIIDAIISIRGI